MEWHRPEKATRSSDLFASQRTLVPLHQEVGKNGFSSNLRKNLTKRYLHCRDNRVQTIFVCKFVITGLFLPILIMVHAVERWQCFFMEVHKGVRAQ